MTIILDTVHHRGLLKAASGTELLSVNRCMGGDVPVQLGPYERASPDEVRIFLPYF
jgi:hypothetical protein